MKKNATPKKEPVYLRLYNQLREDIVNGLYAYQSKLPSKRALAARTGLSTITVEHALALLCEEGYVQAKERSGFIVIFRPSDGFASAPKKELVYHAPQAHTHADFPLSVLSKAMRRVIAERGELLLEKSPDAGCAELRGAIARYLARNRGIRVDAEQIVIGAGSEYLYGLIVELLGRDRIFAIEAPSYKKIEQVYRAAEIAYETLPLTQEGIDSTALAASRADVLHTTPFRSYPSGVSASASKRHEYVRWASEQDRYVIEDDFESEFSVSAKPSETLFGLSQKDNVIYLNTFSKTISPSLRVGYMVLPPRLSRLFAQKLGFYSCTVSTFMQYVLCELIENGDFERHINRVRRALRRAPSEEKN